MVETYRARPKTKSGAVMKTVMSLVLSGLILVTTISPAESKVEEVDVGNLINRVIAGEDFSGREIVISGVALNQTSSGDGLVNIGTNETYKSGAFLNFVSVYDTSVTIKEGKYVSVRVMIESSMATKMGGKSVVLIESAFVECIAC